MRQLWTILSRRAEYPQESYARRHGTILAGATSQGRGVDCDGHFRDDVRGADLLRLQFGFLSERMVTGDWYMFVVVCGAGIFE